MSHGQGNNVNPTEPDAAMRDRVRSLAIEQGFALCGICPARPSDYGRALRDWLDRGEHGEMAWLAEHVEVREDPRKLLEGARSIILVADRLPGERAMPDGPTAQNVEPPVGRVARYAWISDYHKVMKKRLFGLADALREHDPEATFKVCVDTAPLLEREYAARAGLGWVGKHTLLLNAEQGSHLLLGAIVTTLDLPADEPETDHCGSCTRCIDACPTDAITPYHVDARKCISYLTIEHRSEIDPQYHEAMGDWLYGCDICQDVCPFVRKAEREAPDAPPEGYSRKFERLNLLDVLNWDEQARRDAFTRSAMKRAKLDQMKRNALIAAGNHLRTHDDSELRDRIECIVTDVDEPAMVRNTSRQVLQRLDDAEDAPFGDST